MINESLTMLKKYYQMVPHIQIEKNLHLLKPSEYVWKYIWKKIETYDFW